MQKSKIEWTDMTWNPIKGICPVGCWYCYARKMYSPGFYSNKPPFDDPRIRGPFLDDNGFYKIRNKPSKIFTCSTFEIFHPEIKKGTRDLIFSVIEKNPQHIFQILTKMPENIDRPMPDNVWLGVSITDGMDWWRWSYVVRTKAKIKFISHEPIIRETIHFPNDCDWFIIGRLTGHGKKHDPKLGYLHELNSKAIINNTPVFMKNNLKDIWGPNLIQEFPK